MRLFFRFLFAFCEFFMKLLVCLDQFQIVDCGIYFKSLEYFSFGELRDFKLSFEQRNFSFEILVLLLFFLNKFKILHGFKSKNSALFLKPDDNFLKWYRPLFAVRILCLFLDFPKLFFDDLDMILKCSDVIRLSFFNDFFDLLIEIEEIFLELSIGVLDDAIVGFVVVMIKIRLFWVWLSSSEDGGLFAVGGIGVDW